MASVGNVRLMSYLQAAAGLLLLLLLIIISGSATGSANAARSPSGEGWRSTVHHLATQQLTDACLAAIRALNTLAVEHRIPYLLSLVMPREASCKELHGTWSYEVKFVAAVFHMDKIHDKPFVGVAKATYDLLAAGQDPLIPLGNVNGNTLTLSFSQNL